jgi:peptidylprolyl isomerase
MNKLSFIALVPLTLALGCPQPTEPAAGDKPAETPADKPADKPAADKPAHAKMPAPETKPDIPAPEDVAAPSDGHEKTESGLASKVLTKGTGTEKPRKFDEVEVHYTGWTKDGKMFDSSMKRGTPTRFPLNRVIPGWTEGVQLMVEGEKRRFWIPAAMAYGETPRRPGAPAGQLTFDVELLKIFKQAEPPAMPEVPKDVKAPPKNAKKTASGLAYVAIKEGEGADRKQPTPADRVKVHYTGWTTDGKMFDSSIARGTPAMFPLGGVIKGWTEGLQLMKEGDHFRFWIPGDLAYGDKPTRPGAPAGTLVFEVMLIKVMR